PDDLLRDQGEGARRIHPRALLLAVRFEPAPLARELPLQYGRVHLEAAVALAPAVREYVRRRDHLPAPVAHGRRRDIRNDLRGAAWPGLGDLPHPDRRAAS